MLFNRFAKRAVTVATLGAAAAAVAVVPAHATEGSFPIHSSSNCAATEINPASVGQRGTARLHADRPDRRHRDLLVRYLGQQQGQVGLRQHVRCGVAADLRRPRRIPAGLGSHLERFGLG